MTFTNDELLAESVGHVIAGGMKDDFDPYALAEQVLDVVAQAVRERCTPSGEAYRSGGDALVYAVADWIRVSHDHDPGGCTCGCPVKACPPCGGFTTSDVSGSDRG